MGRPSKLTEKQWAEVAKRIEGGETYRALAAAYGVSPTALARRISEQKKQAEEVKELANQLVSAENRIKALPISLQVSAHSIAEDLRAISMHLAGAGKYGAANAHRLSAIAHSQLQKLDDVDPMSEGGVETLRNVAALTKIANEAGEIPTNLLKANKDMVDDLNKGLDKRKPMGLNHFYGDTEQTDAQPRIA